MTVPRAVRFMNRPTDQRLTHEKTPRRGVRGTDSSSSDVGISVSQSASVASVFRVDTHECRRQNTPTTEADRR